MKQKRNERRDAETEIQPAGLSTAEVKRIYDRIASTYERRTTPFESRARARLLDIVASLRAERILEVAVGPGAAFTRILGVNSHGLTVGLDISREMLAEARTKAQRGGHKAYVLLQADARHLPLPDESFDVVTNSYMLDLLAVEDIRDALSEFKRVLKPGGTLVLVNMTHSGSLLIRAWEWLYRRNPSLFWGCRAVLAAPFLEELGFANVHREVITQLAFPSEILRASRP